MEDYPVKPVYDRIFVKKDDEETTSGGVFLPKSVKGRAETGTVIATGPGRLYEDKYIPLCVKPGDRVFVKQFTGYIVRYKDPKTGQTYPDVHVFSDNEIIGVIK